MVTGAGEGAGISRGGIRPVEVGVAVGGVVVQRIGFRLSQAERGYGENYDLNNKMLGGDFLCVSNGLPCTSFLLDCSD